MIRRLPALLLCLTAAVPAAAGEQHPAPVWWETVLGDTRLPVSRMYDTLNAACELITEKSLIPVSASDLAFESVKSLSSIDGKINVVKDGKRVLILADGRILKSFTAPADDDCADWSRLTLAAAVAARPYSGKAQKADAEEFFNIFLNAALGKIDSYSHYTGADPADPVALKNPAGVGINYRRIGKYLEITEILPDTPAAHSDLTVGDRISAINGRNIADLSRIEALNRLRGEEGTEVFLTLRRDGKPLSRALKRGRITASPVTYLFDEKSRLMTIRIAAFSQKTVSGLRVTLEKAEKLGAAGLIIDLRGNTGGLLKQAVLAADLFLPEGLSVIKTNGRANGTRQEYTSTAKEKRPVYPIALLVDSKTASSAEFFAGVLQEYRHGVVIGTPTFGKGVIQSDNDTPDGGHIYLTWARYTLPSGYSPQGYGIYPNLCTSGMTLSNVADALPVSQTQLKPWRQGDDSFKRKALAACPPQPRKDNPVEEEVAKQILTDPERYERSLTYFSLD